jgi:hypothetical protein
MILGLLIAAAIASTPPAPPAPVPLSPQTQALIAPVHEAIVKARAELAALPAPKDDGERLQRMRKLEQAPRAALSLIDFSKVAQAERAAAYEAIDSQIRPIDHANQEALLAMLPPEGWFTISRYGSEGSTSAFLIIQHSNIGLWRRFVPVLKNMAAKGEVKGGDYALMYDRLATTEHRPQRYGSQMTCQAGRYAPAPIEDPEHIDERRAALGMSPYKDYLALFANNPSC